MPVHTMLNWSEGVFRMSRFISGLGIKHLQLDYFNTRLRGFCNNKLEILDDKLFIKLGYASAFVDNITGDGLVIIVFQIQPDSIAARLRPGLQFQHYR